AGVTTTPSVAYLTAKDGFDCGIMISASHNPYYDNGIKLFGADGCKLGDDTIAQIEEYLDGGFDLPRAQREGVGRAVAYSVGRKKYVEYLLSLSQPLNGIKIGLDCANGASYKLAREVFEKLGASVTVINASPDGLNINDNCGSTHLGGLQQLVKQNGLDVGFAFDGDADRCLCVDENGDAVNGDKILYVCGKYLKECGLLANDEVVTTVMSNFGLYKAFDKIGLKYAMTAVGDRFVHEYMTEHGATLGGEQSGHIIFSQFATTGDGILTALVISEVMINRRSPLSALCAPVSEYPQLLVNVRVGDKQAALNDDDVQGAVKAAAERLDGRGRILVRGSGTEQLVRVMVEAEDNALCEEFAQSVVNVIREKGYGENVE
ncbi:MAG: phosphoglucosamine mutase, partial [Clostridia bacterium]|nr:phosphoglucosamine mutase [Clostridia bacterium]